tara:strand:- start:410 stop:661 length:252 start_codon:yes stop_codon:yes gene_type:complete
MKILYFSWIKDQIGKAEESLDIKDNIQTIEELVNFLKNINDNYKSVFTDVSSIKVSINMEIASFKDKINKEDEVAFFPPMTGG